MSRSSQPHRRILMTLDAVGGVWRYALDLAEALRPRGFDFVFAGFGPPPSPVQQVEADALGKTIWIDAPLDWTASDPQALAVVPSLLQRIITQERAELAHLNLPSQAATLQSPVPVLAVSHSCVPTWFSAVREQRPPAEWAWHVDLNRQGFDKSDVVIAPSRSHAAALRAVYGEIGNLTVVNNGSHADSISPAKRNLVAGAGRWWDEGKNGAVLDAAAASILWPVELAGPTEGPSGQRITFRHARHRGNLSHQDALNWMGAAAVFVSPSRYEPFGLAPLEAARTGAALVLADIPTYRELWGDAAVFFAPGSSGELAEAVNALSRDRGRRDALGARARLRSMTFSTEAQAIVMEAIYRDLLGSKSTSNAAE